MSPYIPTRGRRIETTDTTARTAITAIIPIISARLSFEPNVLIANDFSHSGVASIAAFPTATSGDAWSSMNEASTSATPRANAAVSRPITAPRSRRVRAGSDALVADLVWVLTLDVSSRWDGWTDPGRARSSA